MTTKIRAEISEKSKYYIDKHRHYELKHFCLQYPKWKREYAATPSLASSGAERLPTTNIPGDPTASIAMRKAYYKERIKLVEKTAIETDRVLCDYILRGVTEELPYTYLKSKLNIPCGRDMYYDRYRRFFWLLSKSRK